MLMSFIHLVHAGFEDFIELQVAGCLIPSKAGIKTSCKWDFLFSWLRKKATKLKIKFSDAKKLPQHNHAVGSSWLIVRRLNASVC